MKRMLYGRSLAFMAALPLSVAIGGCRTAAPGSATTSTRASAAQEAAIRSIRNEQSIKVSDIPQRTIAVVPLDIASSDTMLAPLSYGIAHMLMMDLGVSKQLQPVERLQMDALLRELDLAASGRVDSATAPKVGKLIGARRLIVGSVGFAPGGGQDIVMDARVADVVTGAVRAATPSRGSLNQIFDAEKALVLELFRQLNVTLTERERALLQRRPTTNLAAFLAYSRGAREEAFGRYDRAAQEYQRAVSIDPNFRVASARLNDAKSMTLPGSSIGGGQLERATGVAARGVNTAVLPSARGAADPSFPAQTVRITVVITTPP